MHGWHPENSLVTLSLLQCIHFFFCADHPHSLCLDTYYVPLGFVPTVVSHENGFATLLSTVKIIECSTAGPKESTASVSSSVRASYPGELPRDEQQVSNFKKRNAGSGSTYVVVYLEKGNDLYIVMLQAH